MNENIRLVLVTESLECEDQGRFLTKSFYSTSIATVPFLCHYKDYKNDFLCLCGLKNHLRPLSYNFVRCFGCQENWRSWEKDCDSWLPAHPLLPSVGPEGCQQSQKHFWNSSILDSFLAWVRKTQPLLRQLAKTLKGGGNSWKREMIYYFKHFHIGNFHREVETWILFSE